MKMKNIFIYAILFYYTINIAYSDKITIEKIFDSTNIPLKYINGPTIQNISIKNGIIFNHLNPIMCDNYIMKSELSNINWTLFGRDTAGYELNNDGLRIDNGDSCRQPYYERIAIFEDPFTYIGITDDYLFKYDGKSLDYFLDSIPRPDNSYFGFNDISTFEDCSAIITGSSKIFITDNCGKSWQNITPDSIKFNFKGVKYKTFGNIKVIDKNKFRVTFKYYTYPTIDTEIINYTVLETNDAGKNWEQIAKLTSDVDGVKLYELYFVDSNNGWWCGGRYISPMKFSKLILNTTDGGHKWMIQLDTNNGEKSFEKIKFYDKNFGVAFSLASLYYTLNGGKDWKILKFKDYDSSYIKVNCVTFIDNKSFLIGTFMRGYIFKISISPSISVETVTEIETTIFPNPATDYLNIAFDSPKEGLGTIEIIDLLGIKVCSFETYINEGINSIKYSELDNLQTASYTIKVTINNEIVSIGKFIKQ